LASPAVAPRMEFDVVRGESADALVNAAGTSLRMGSGVAGALRRAGGGPIDAEAVSEGPVELGGVAVTDAYELDDDDVTHAAAMPHRGDGRATADSIRAATRNALGRAAELGCESVVVPVLGTGAAGFDFEAGARSGCGGGAAYDPPRAAGPDDGRASADDADQYRTLEGVAADVRS